MSVNPTKVSHGFPNQGFRDSDSASIRAPIPTINPVALRGSRLPLRRAIKRNPIPHSVKAENNKLVITRCGRSPVTKKVTATTEMTISITSRQLGITRPIPFIVDTWSPNRPQHHGHIRCPTHRMPISDAASSSPTTLWPSVSPDGSSSKDCVEQPCNTTDSHTGSPNAEAVDNQRDPKRATLAIPPLFHHDESSEHQNRS